METFKLGDPLPESISKTLVALVKNAEQNHSLDVFCFIHSPDGVTHYISIGNGKSDGIELTIPSGNPITSLEKVGYLEKQEDGHTFLLPSAFHRAKYERKNRFGKWIDRTIDNGRDFLLGVSFTLSLLLMIKELFSM